MTVGLNASQARANANEDMLIYDEVQTLMKEIITQSVAGNYSATVDDGTTMTEATPTAVVTGSIANPTITATPTLILDGQTITLGTTGTNLNSVIADINDANPTGIVASKNSANNLVLTFTSTANQTWEYIIGSGTANASLGLTAGTNAYTSPTSVDFFNAWQGTATDRSRVVQMDKVIKHFKNLGYKIERTTNTSTAKTFQWKIDW